MLHGLKDQICDPNLAKDLFNKIPSENKKMFLYPNGFHELFNDTEADKYKKELLGFLNEVLSSNPQVLGVIKKAYPVQAEKTSSFNKRYIIAIVLGLIYLKGLYWLRRNSTYQNNKLALYFYPIYWIYKLLSISSRQTLNYMRSIFAEIGKETSLY